MNTSRKFFIFTSTLLLLFAIAIIINAAINFRSYSLQSTYEKAQLVAQIVRDGLTAHMLSNTMDKRTFFLRSIAQTKEIKNLWIVRSEKVIKQYGKGLLNEKPKDPIDHKVLQTGEPIQKLLESRDSVLFRITIPYIASAYSDPNCLSCHKVHEGDVLGAISLEFDISHIRHEGIMTLLKIGAITLVFILIALIAVKILTKPYIDFFERLQQSLTRARNGDFDLKVETKIQATDIRAVAKLYNLLIEKFQNTIGTIEHKLAILIKNPISECQDPLIKASKTIDILSDIHRFKMTIEHDPTVEQIFERIAEVIKAVMKTEKFVIYHVDSKKNTRSILYTTMEAPVCSKHSMSNAQECRTFRTQNIVSSDLFPELCKHYSGLSKYYYCVPFLITEHYSIVIMLMCDTKEEIDHFKENLFTLTNYLENAKPVIESRLLMEKLQEKSLRDGLTGLYNRKFLEEFIDKVNKQAERHAASYTIMMLDIDYFKQVNDKYGHDVGDKFIKLLAQTIISNIRASDIAARYGGEEFLLLLHESTPEGAQRVAEKIRQSFAQKTVYVHGKQIRKTVSIGVSFFPQHAKALREAIKYADVALYKAKEDGRNRVVIFEPDMYQHVEY
ncbi:MAG: GGDEF domain-containing protein [Hydrogenimonas sp.]|nr:MAG: GGDEF domain-containing protein [Hydrogenimonas sp.]